MLYGRLDIYGPDGSIKTFPLSSPNVSVGRSSGNTIMLDNSSISRYHFSLTHEDDEVFITDLESANGTHVDGMRLTGNDPRLLGGGEEIQIGNLRIIFHRIETSDDSPTQPIMPLPEVTQRIKSADAEFSIDLHGPDQSVAPGAHISAELSITNLIDEERRYVVEVTGLPKEWVRVDRPNPFVDANDSTFVLINFKPLRRSESKPGDYKVGIRVYPQEKPDTAIETTLVLSVLPYSGFGIALQSRRVSANERFYLHLHNQGSNKLPLTVYGRDRNGVLNFNILTPQVALAPGQQLTVQGEVKARKSKLIGQTRQYPFDVVVRANNNAGFVTAVRGYYVDKAVMPGWVPVLLASTIGLIGLVLAVVLLVFLQQPVPAPNFASVELSSGQLARGDQLEVRWQATDVVEYRLRLNETEVAYTTDPRATAFAVDTRNYSGDVTVRLEGFNGQQQTSQERTIRIYEPLGVVERFVVLPAQLVRYVEQPLTIEWHVPGAVLTRITGLENFRSAPLEVNGSQGVISGVIVRPVDPLRLVLTAYDEANNQLQETLTINVSNPECTPTAAAVTLYTGPGALYQVVGTVPPGDSVVVNARDASSEWLRVLLPGAQTGWGMASAFICENFAVNALVVETNIPPLPSTSTPTPTALPASTPPPAPTATPLG